MPTGSLLDTHLFQACLLVWFLAYGTIIVAVEVTNVWTFALLILGPLLSYIILKYFSLSPSDRSQVTEILGLDFRKERDRAERILKNILSNNVSEDDQDVLVLKVIAHRFAGIDAPENSLRALEECYQKGCVAVEFDVAMTKDKVPIVFHDDTLDRLANLSKEIKAMTWDELQSVDISINHPFHERFKDTKVALLDDVVKKCVENDIRMFMDIKDSSAEMIDAVCTLFDKYPTLFRRAVVSSFNPLAVYMVRERKPGVVGSMAWRPSYFSLATYSPVKADCVRRASASSPLSYLMARAADLVTTWLFNNIYYQVVGLSTVLLHKDTITHEVINWWEERGVRVIAWSVNVPSEKVHFARNLQIAYLTDTMAGD